MKKHFTNKEIIKYLDEQVTAEKKARVKQHLAECKECLVRYNKLKKILNPYYNKVFLSKNLLPRILRSYQQIRDENPVKISQNRFFKNPYFKYGMSFALILFVLFSGFYFFPRHRKEQLFFSIDKLEGNILLNKKFLSSKNLLFEKSRLILSKNSRLEISYTNKMKIILAGENDFFIKEAFLNIKEKQSNFNFKMNKGLVFVNTSGKLLYSFKTGQAVITPLGTRFLLKCNNNKTELYLKEGHVNIVNMEGKKITAFPLYKYLITKNSIEKSLLSVKDERYIKNMISGEIQNSQNILKQSRQQIKVTNQEKDQNEQPSKDAGLRKELQRDKRDLKKELQSDRGRNRNRNR